MRLSYFLGLSSFLLLTVLPGCGGKSPEVNLDTTAQALPLDMYPELGLANSSDSLNGGLVVKNLTSGEDAYAFGYNAQNELVRAKMTVGATGEMYEFIFQADGAAGLCKIQSASLKGWAPLREERPVALIQTLQGPVQNLSATSLDSLAEVLLSYRMDLMVNEP